MRLLAIQKVLIVSILLVMVLSTIGVILSGQPPYIAFFYSLMNILGSDFIISNALIDAPSRIMLTVQVLDVMGNLMLTILLTTIFYQMLSTLDLRYILARNMIKRLNHHVVLAPGNEMSIALARRLRDNNVKSVIVEKDFYRVSELVSRGLLAYHGNPTDPQALINAGIKNASTLVILDKEDAYNMYIAMTAKKLNGRLRIASRLRNLEDLSKLSKVGIRRVVMPEIAVGKEIGNFLVGSVPVKVKS